MTVDRTDPAVPCEIRCDGARVPFRVVLDRIELFREFERIVRTDPDSPGFSRATYEAMTTGRYNLAGAAAAMALHIFEEEFARAGAETFDRILTVAINTAVVSCKQQRNESAEPEGTIDARGAALPVAVVMARREMSDFRRQLINCARNAELRRLRKRPGAEATANYGAIRREVDAVVAAMREKRGAGAAYERGDQESAFAIVAENRNMRVDTVKRYYSRGKRLCAFAD